MRLLIEYVGGATALVVDLKTVEIRDGKLITDRSKEPMSRIEKIEVKP